MLSGTFHQLGEGLEFGYISMLFVPVIIIGHYYKESSVRLF